MLSSRMYISYCIHTSIKLLTFNCILLYSAYIRNRVCDKIIGAYQVANSQKPFRKCFTRTRKLLASLLHFTNLPECLIKQLHIFPMKDYNAYILEYITKTLVPGFSSFLTIYIPELWQ